MLFVVIIMIPDLGQTSISKQHGPINQMPHSAASGQGLHCLPFNQQ